MKRANGINKSLGFKNKSVSWFLFMRLKSLIKLGNASNPAY